MVISYYFHSFWYIDKAQSLSDLHRVGCSAAQGHTFAMTTCAMGAVAGAALSRRRSSRASWRKCTCSSETSHDSDKCLWQSVPASL